MEWWIRPKLKVPSPFFPLKNRPSQSYSLYSSASIFVKIGSPDPADFVMTWHLIHWRVLALCAMVGTTVGISRSSQRNMPTDLKPDCSKIHKNLPAVAYRAKPCAVTYRAVTTAIYQRSPQPLCKWP
jgi:hypothetical protein